MNQDHFNPRLSQIATRWSLVLQAVQCEGDEVYAAQQQLMQRYSSAIYHYLLAILRNPDLAEDMLQEFALRCIRGDFRRLAPCRGRFRDFIKTTLRNLVIDHHRRQRARPAMQSLDGVEAFAWDTKSVDLDATFLANWRDELLAHAWEALAQVEEETGQLFHTVLTLRVRQPQLRSEEMATYLETQQGISFTASGVRQLLHRARTRFTALLFQEVRRTLDNPTAEEVEQELRELGLLVYCQPVRKAPGFTEKSRS